jgi:hypothetical protein
MLKEDSVALEVAAAPRPLASLIADIDATVHEVRTSRVSGSQFRRLANERKRLEQGAYASIGAAARIRGG